jgi:uncharacterized membrane protein
MSNYNFTKKELKQDLLILVLGIILVIVSFNSLMSFVSNDDNKYLKKESSKIEKEIKQYELENKKLSEKVLGYEKLLLKIDSSISLNNKKIDKLKFNTNEKINSFKSYDASMWEKFFADRYKE